MMEQAFEENREMKDCTRYSRDVLPKPDHGTGVAHAEKRIREQKAWEAAFKDGKQEDEGNGGRTRVQYDLPPKAEQIQDLIEYRNMNFARGEMFKSLYRGDTCEHSGDLREARKVLWFAQREVDRLTSGQ